MIFTYGIISSNYLWQLFMKDPTVHTLYLIKLSFENIIFGDSVKMLYTAPSILPSGWQIAAVLNNKKKIE